MPPTDGVLKLLYDNYPFSRTNENQIAVNRHTKRIPHAKPRTCAMINQRNISREKLVATARPVRRAAAKRQVRRQAMSVKLWSSFVAFDVLQFIKKNSDSTYAKRKRMLKQHDSDIELLYTSRTRLKTEV